MSYTTRNGQRLHVAVAAAFDRLAAEFKRVWGLDLIVSSGVRTRAEQQYLYDGWITRKPGFNLAAKPGYSNHEIDGPIGPRAVDLRDSGADAGVTVIGSRRSNWLAANAGRFGFKNAGHFFSPREGSHYEYTGSLDTGLVVDGILGAATWRAVQINLGGLTVDGIEGPNTVRRLQAALSVQQDGKRGPLTNKAWQRWLGVTQDGIFGRNSVTALQNALNAGRAIGR